MFSVLVNGDRYSANTAEADGSLLTSAAFRASYRDYYPNGESCDERPCRLAVLVNQE